MENKCFILDHDNIRWKVPSNKQIQYKFVNASLEFSNLKMFYPFP